MNILLEVEFAKLHQMVGFQRMDLKILTIVHSYSPGHFLKQQRSKMSDAGGPLVQEQENASVAQSAVVLVDSGRTVWFQLNAT